MGIFNYKSLLFLFVINASVQAFVGTTTMARPPFMNSSSRATRLFAELPDIDTMKASEMRKELESYGISTKSLFEKGEFVEALKKARAEGKTAVNNNNNNNNSSSAGTTNGENANVNNGDSGASSESSTSREERYQEALEKAKTMKVGELKKELTSRGISTASFFEKTEFVKAYAEAIADNKQGGGGSSSSRPRDEPRDPSYRDVNMQKINKGSMMGQKVIDVMLGRD